MKKFVCSVAVLSALVGCSVQTASVYLHPSTKTLKKEQTAFIYTTGLPNDNYGIPCGGYKNEAGELKFPKIGAAIAGIYSVVKVLGAGEAVTTFGWGDLYYFSGAVLPANVEYEITFHSILNGNAMNTIRVDGMNMRVTDTQYVNLASPMYINIKKKFDPNEIYFLLCPNGNGNKPKIYGLREIMADKTPEEISRQYEQWDVRLKENFGKSYWSLEK